jgi:hypothetical protein
VRNCEGFSGGGELGDREAYRCMRIQAKAVNAGLIAAIAITIGTGTPGRLPEIALGSTALFHLERTVVLLAAYVFVVVILSRAWRGELPSEMSGQGIKYSGELTKNAAEDAVAAILEAMDKLEKRVRQLEEPG